MFSKFLSLVLALTLAISPISSKVLAFDHDDSAMERSGRSGRVLLDPDNEMTLEFKKVGPEPESRTGGTGSRWGSGYGNGPNGNKDGYGVGDRHFDKGDSGSGPSVAGGRGSNKTESNRERAYRLEREQLSRQSDTLGTEIDKSIKNYEDNFSKTTDLAKNLKDNLSSPESNPISAERPDSNTLKEKQNLFTRATGGPAEENVLAEEGIIDPPKSVAFHSPPSAFRTALESIQSKLNKTTPASPQGERAKTVGLAAIKEADRANARGDTELAENLKEVATTMADIGLGLYPPTSLAKDLYESTTGKHALTGRQLDNIERSLAVLGVVTAGLGGSIKSTVKGVSRVVDAVKETKGIKSGIERGQRVFKELSHLASQAKKAGIESSKSVAYMTKVAHGPVAKTEAEVMRLGLKHQELSEAMKHVPGKSWSGTMTRAVPETIEDSNGKIIGNKQGWWGLKEATNNGDTVFDWHEGMKNYNARYGIGGKYGEPVMSAAIGTDSKRAIQTALEEAAGDSTKPFIVASKEMSFNKVLDLTDPSSVRSLSLDLTDLVSKPKDNTTYDISQIIGSVARDHGFDAIITTSSATKTEPVIHILKKGVNR